MTVNGKVIKAKTLWLLGLIAAGSLVTQEKHVNAFLSSHPRLEPFSGLILTALALIHNPSAQQFVTQILTVPPDSEIEQKTKITSPSGSTQPTEITTITPVTEEKK